MTDTTESTATDAGSTDRDAESTRADAESTDQRPGAPDRDAGPGGSGQAARMTPPPVVVPETATAVVCDYCGHPFADEDLLALHRGLAHPDDIDAAERDAFEDAYERESDRLRLFRLKALGIIVVLYFGLLMTYALVS